MPDAANNMIMLTLHHCGESTGIKTFQGQYHSLMSLIVDQLAIPGFGLCCGMGSCGTCLVQITDPYSPVKRNVLACAIQVNDELANMDIIVPDKMY
jgi:aerobic-type carbon monoxide dehydrogenase small subunit (CoxS/CutS family)